MTNIRRNQLLAVGLLLVVASSTAAVAEEPAISKQIIGTWESEVFKRKMGRPLVPMRVEVTFGSNGLLMTTTTLVIEGQPIPHDSITYIRRYRIVKGKFHHISDINVSGPQVHINGPTMTFSYEEGEQPQKIQFTKRNKTKSIERVLTKAIADLKSPNPQVPFIAVQVLRDAGPEARAAIPGLIALLKGDNFSAGILAAEALANIGPGEKGVVLALCDLLNAKPVSFYRSFAANELGKFGPAAKEAVPHLITLLKQKDDNARCQAATALGNIGPAAKPALPILVDYLKDEAKSVATAAEVAIEKIEPNGGQHPEQL